MGLTHAATPNDSASTRVAATEHSTTSTPAHSTADLPPQALELAERLFDLARSGDTAQLEGYVAAGIPPNLTNHKGDTLLMLAAYHGHADTVRALIGLGADVDVRNDRGQSPVAGAVFKGFDAVVEILVAAGADVRAGQPSAVDAARMFRRDACMRLFGMEAE